MRRALVVEDYDSVRELVVMALRADGWDVTETWDVVTTQRAWVDSLQRDDPFELVVLDNRIPVRKGGSVVTMALPWAELIREHSKVLVFSADDLSLECQALDVEYLCKGCSMRSFMSIVRGMFGETFSRRGPHAQQ